ncbi:MAG: hypothetical protein ACI4MG_09565 [Aristaeellaceae bacterium]
MQTQVIIDYRIILAFGVCFIGAMCVKRMNPEQIKETLVHASGMIKCLPLNKPTP